MAAEWEREARLTRRHPLSGLDTLPEIRDRELSKQSQATVEMPDSALLLADRAVGDLSSSIGELGVAGTLQVHSRRFPLYGRRIRPLAFASLANVSAIIALDASFADGPSNRKT